MDLIFGTHNVYKLAELLADSAVRTGTAWSSISGRILTRSWRICRSERKYTFKSGVNIMFGCNNFCSYCIVPYVRGRERSRSARGHHPGDRRAGCGRRRGSHAVGPECQFLRKEPGDPNDLCGASAARWSRSTGIRRIRFMTSHPKDLSDELIEVMAESKKICRHLHLPLAVRQQPDLKSHEPPVTRRSSIWNWRRRSARRSRIFP